MTPNFLDFLSMADLHVKQFDFRWRLNLKAVAAGFAPKLLD